MCFTDPPWNVAIGNDSNPKHRQRDGLLNDNMSSKEFSEFLLAFIVNFKSYISGDFYCCLGGNELSSLDILLRDNDFHWSSTIVWIKDQFVMGRSKYHRRYEPIWFGWQNKSKSSFGKMRDQDDAWEIPRPKVSPEHPTMKPVALVAKAINNSSKSGDIVIDPFGGSGSTLIACEQTNRRCYTMELSPHYCDVIIKRWEQLTENRAKKVS